MSWSGRRSVNSPPLLLGDEHPVEPGEAISIHLPLKLLRYLMLGLPAQFPGHDLAGPLANAVSFRMWGSAEDRGYRSGRRWRLPAPYPGAHEGRSPIVLQERKEADGRSASGDHSRVARPVKRAAAGASA
jgi:hypothetical protein